MKKNLKLTMTALVAALCMTAAVPAYATATDDYSLEIHDLQVKADDLQSQLDQLKAHIDELAGKTGVSTSDASAAGTATDAVADGETAQGQNILLNEMVAIPDYADFSVIGTEFVDTVVAKAAAEDSLKVLASAGNTLYHARFLYQARINNIYAKDAFTVYLVIDGKKYENGRQMFESKNASGTEALAYTVDDCKNAEYGYLVNSGNSVESMGHGATWWTMHDYAVEVPTEVVSSAESAFLQIQINGTDLNFTVPLS